MAEIYDKTSSLWTEDTTPDMQADYAPAADTSAAAMKRVKLWRLGQGAKGADIASAATLNLDTATGDLVDVTGTTTITAITLAEGRHRTVRFTGILTLTHGASLVLPTGANISTVAGDFAVFRGYAAGVVRCVSYTRASGAALVGGATTASTTEVLTGTDTGKAVTPDALAALWEQGSDIASGASISVGEGGYFNITGTTSITDIDFATDKAGRKVWLKFAGVLTLTHHATTLILPTGANITTAAGDIACFVSEGGDNVRCISYTRASGGALTGEMGPVGIFASDTFAGVAMRVASGNSQVAGIGGGGQQKFALYKPSLVGTGTSYAQITANQNDYSLVDYLGPIVRLNSDASRNITGACVQGTVPPDGYWVWIVNVGSFDIVLTHQDAASTAAYRFLSSTGANITLAPNQAAEMWYDNTTGRWRVFKKN